MDGEPLPDLVARQRARDEQPADLSPDPDVARGLFAIASAIDRLADAICEASGKPALPPNY